MPLSLVVQLRAAQRQRGMQDMTVVDVLDADGHSAQQEITVAPAGPRAEVDVLEREAGDSMARWAMAVGFLLGQQQAWEFEPTVGPWDQTAAAATLRVAAEVIDSWQVQLELAAGAA